MKRTSQNINKTDEKTVNDTHDQDSKKSILTKQKMNYQEILIRGIFWFILNAVFIGFVYFGMPSLFIMTLIIQTKGMHELLNFVFKRLKCQNIKWSKVTSWYFYAVATYYCYANNAFTLLRTMPFKSNSTIRYLQNNHLFVSYVLYMIGFMGFVMTADKVHFRSQYLLFGFIHICMILIKVTSLAIYNLFEGVIWYFLPALLVIINDTFAYVFGNCFGKRKLTHLSPKKTWEGFIGAAMLTIFASLVLSAILLDFPSLICSLNELSSKGAATICKPKDMFKIQTYELPASFHHYFSEIEYKPFILHAIAISLFASFVAPFGGFLASGFKRFIETKDFSETIPGHVGFLDRTDCIIVMIGFINVYLNTFIIKK